MKRLLLALMLAASPVAAAECSIPLDVALEGVPAGAQVTLTADEITTVRGIWETTGHAFPVEVVSIVAVTGELTQTVLLIGLDKDHCVNGAAVVSARVWVAVHGVGA
jgi:hypothetical protein